MNLWIHRDDAVPLRLHIGRYSMTGTQRAVGEPYHSNGSRSLEQVRDGVGIRQGSHERIVTRAPKFVPGRLSTHSVIPTAAQRAEWRDLLLYRDCRCGL